MPVNLASPGIRVREVDLTVGRIDPSSPGIGAIVGPFSKGPVNLPTLITSEQELIDVFGKPDTSNNLYEYWLTASSFLSYGGSLRVVRVASNALINAGITTTVINSVEQYEQLGYDDNTFNAKVVARQPGDFGNGLRVGFIDGKADQIISGFGSTSSVSLGQVVEQSVAGQKYPKEDGSVETLTGILRGVITEIGTDQISVKVFSHVPDSGVGVSVDYIEKGAWSFRDGTITVKNSSGTGVATDTSVTTSDWFKAQELVVGTEVLSGVSTDRKVKWSTLVDRPTTTSYAAARGSRHDEVHIAVIDSAGKVTGNAGTILEVHKGLSKAKDAELGVGTPSYWRKYLKNNSQYIFGGNTPSITQSTGLTTLDGNAPQGGAWNSDAEGVIFEGLGAFNELLSGGVNYSADATLSELVAGYDLFMNKEKYEVDFILMGGSGAHTKEEAQAVAQKCIAVAAARQDAIAFISPHRGAFVEDLGSSTVSIKNDREITDNVIDFYGPLTSSSYAVFDSGYKYMYDRFGNTFRYVPLNGDIAGLCARNDANNFPWFSPAGNSRGAILNAVKLAYNPDKSQRDELYSARINPVIQSPGSGIILFGDKTGLGKSSAFDRINVRRLFIYLEDAISAAANDQLFEFNDEITRTNFVNIVEPFLRDVQSKRGIFDYVVICDETNNTGAVIDNNEFVADIYIKPARSINFIGLTFVATRTGVAFEEVIGNV